LCYFFVVIISRSFLRSQNLFINYLELSGKFNDVAGADSCKSCANNSYSSEKGREISCIHCPIGFRSLSEGSAKCQPCGAGTFGDGCKLCPVGYARHDSDSDTTKCRNCDLGETTPIEGASICDKCDLGKYGDRKGSCSDCPSGTYQDGKGETTCKKCDVDTYLSETGKSSKADCVKCDSKRSTGLLTGRTNSSACLCKRTKFFQNDNNECDECPLGADCSKHDGMKLVELFAEPGYYRPSKKSKKFVSCSQGYSGLDSDKKAKERCCPKQYINNNAAGVGLVSICQSFNESSDINMQCLQG
jgi:hypothetical protein